MQGQKIVWVKKDYYHSDTISYLRSVHQDDQPVIDSDNDVTLPDSALPSRATLHNVLHDQVETLVLTEETQCQTDSKQIFYFHKIIQFT